MAMTVVAGALSSLWLWFICSLCCLILCYILMFFLFKLGVVATVYRGCYTVLCSRAELIVRVSSYIEIEV